MISKRASEPRARDPESDVEPGSAPAPAGATAELRDRALRLLARREYSYVELRRRLAGPDADPELLTGVLDGLRARGMLSDARFADQIAFARREKRGPRAVAAELRQKGVDQELIDQAVAPLAAHEIDTARAVWARKFGRLPASAAERAKQMRFLLGRGFSTGAVQQVLAGADQAEPDD